MKKIAVIGLGYVGLPLAVEFGKKRPVIGFDVNEIRIERLRKGEDHTLECSFEELQGASWLDLSSDINSLKDARIYIITVPTPVDNSNRPDLTLLIRASETVAEVLKRGDIVIYESTVFPGATEEVCVPVLEEGSGFKLNVDFYCGYSPERINPGDKEHRLPTIKKVTSGSTPIIAEEIDRLYSEIIIAGTYMASSIKVAEAAKIIENTQRDVNIALMNELSLIFSRLGIDTLEVLETAATKWNFLDFKPGLVGGHCIGVDPYYLTHKAEQVGYHPEVILAGRRINDNVANHVAAETIKLMLSKGISPDKGKVLVLGFSFKENCPDARNTKVADLVKALENFTVCVEIYDPNIDTVEVKKEYGFSCLPRPPEEGQYSAIIIAVGHKQFIELGPEGIRKWGQANSVIFDIKGILPVGMSDGRL